MTAAEKVFDIPELCEAILLQLPPQDLLVSAQRVSKFWRDSITSSTAIQRKRFFKQIPSSGNDDVPKANPLFDKVFNKPRNAREINASSIRATRESPKSIPTTEISITMNTLTSGIPSSRLRRLQLWHKMYIADRPCDIRMLLRCHTFNFTEWKESVTKGKVMSRVLEEYWERP